MLTGTPKLYVSIRLHQDRYITYEFLAMVYGTRFHKLLTHLDLGNSNISNNIDNNNGNKVDVQFPHILVQKLHTQACEIVAGTKRKLCKKFQIDICKTKKDRSAHAQLCTL